MGSYNTLAKPANVTPGLTAFYFCEKGAFSAIQAATSGTQTISSAHTFPAGEGFKTAYLMPDSHTGKGSTAGSKGSQTLKNEFTVFLPGISDEILTFIKKGLNEEFITLHRDADCDNPLILQLGNECKGAIMTSDLEIGTTEPNGQKGFMLKFTWPGIPYIYDDVITMKP